ncbi:ABC transporter substrate-binding protein [Austwickia chelonae]|uniref:ABC transporter substrate-binding protein n=1 Tax=Austwickia chelonae TaxID=100225 RepID=UPI0013C37A36|nr:ABC transporter substrate-binding protein [Austwickia chelonae]
MADSFSRRSFLTSSGRILSAGAIAGFAVRGAGRAVGSGSAEATGLTGTEPDPTRPRRTLRAGYLPITDASSVLLAHELGEFARAGLPSARPRLFRSWESLAQALVTGQIDLAHLLLPTALQLRMEHGLPVKVVSWAHTNGSALTVAPQIRAVRDLAGSRIAVPAWWSVHNLLAQAVLRAEGMVPKIRRGDGDVELVVMPPAEMLSALAAGHIAGFVVADPFTTMAAARGSGHILRFLGDIWHDHGCCAVVVHDRLIDEHPEMVQAAVDAIAAASHWLDTHRSTAADLLTAHASPYLPHRTEIVRAVHTREQAAGNTLVHHPEWRGEHFGTGLFPFPSATSALVELMRSSLVDAPTGFLSAIDPQSVHHRLVDDRFIRTALSGRIDAVLHRTEEIRP